MKNYVNTQKYIIGKLNSILEKPFFGSKQIFDNLKKYKILSNLKKPSENNKYRVDIIELHEKIIIARSLYHHLPTLEYYQLLHEAEIVKNLSHLSDKNSSDKIIFPEYIKLIESKNEVNLMREYLKGTALSQFDKNTKIQTLKKIFLFFEKNSSRSTSALFQKRGRFYSLVFTIEFFVIACIKEPKNIPFFCQMMLKSLINYLKIHQVLVNKFLIAHRDLHSKNILINNKQIIIIDPEICVLAEQTTDIAISCRFFIDELKTQDLIDLINQFVCNKTLLNAFIRLSIYYSFQTIAMQKKGSRFYKQAVKYQKILNKDILPNIHFDK